MLRANIQKIGAANRYIDLVNKYNFSYIFQQNILDDAIECHRRLKQFQIYIFVNICRILLFFKLCYIVASGVSCMFASWFDG